MEKVLDILDKQDYQVPVIDLIKIQSGDPYRVLVGTILSARTKDETTASACKRLFAKAPNSKRLSKLTVKQIEKLIFPVGFYKNKARFLHALPNFIQEGIPETIEELVKLPGVGRKTANLVVAVGFDKPAICVDVHVHRITNRMGYLRTKTPLETEMRLRKKLPIAYWQKINRLLVAFGQNLCRPVSPHCSVCPVKKYCKRVGVHDSR